MSQNDTNTLNNFAGLTYQEWSSFLIVEKRRKASHFQQSAIIQMCTHAHTRMHGKAACIQGPRTSPCTLPIQAPTTCRFQNSCVCQIQYRVLIIPHNHEDEKLDEVKLSKMAPSGPIVTVSKSILVISSGCFIVRTCHNLSESLGSPIISSHFLFGALLETIVTCAKL